MDPRRELSQIRKHLRNHTRVYGETVVYFEYVTATTPASVGSQYDSVYDEGIAGASGRKYKTGVQLSVLHIDETEDQKRAIPEGRQPIQVVEFTASIDDFRSAGIIDPFEYQSHLNDMFLYDGRYYGVGTYRVRGRAKDDLFVMVQGYEIYINEELPFDPGPASLTVQNLPWPSTIANL